MIPIWNYTSSASYVNESPLLQISSTLDTHVLKEVLANIVVITSANDTVIVNGKKSLQAGLTVGGSGIRVHSGFINRKMISDLARLDIPQTFIGKFSKFVIYVLYLLCIFVQNFCFCLHLR